jgi:ABC-type nickel/cobalt efflux system permease component RcnA
MTLGGWLMLVLSWVAILCLAVFAVWRTLRAKPRELSAPLDIEAKIEESEAEKERREEA